MKSGIQIITIYVYQNKHEPKPTPQEFKTVKSSA